MFDLSYFLDTHSWGLLLLIFLGLGSVAFLGKFTWGREFSHDATSEKELQIILGATLSLFGLLVGFLLSIAIGGYNTRVAAEENEAIAIGNAFQRTTLLQEEHQAPAKELLLAYLQLRTQFFQAADDEARAKIRLESIQLQTRMWAMISKIAKVKPDPILAMALNACNDLYTAQQKTLASWRNQVPGTAWAILLVFGLCSNFLIGYNVRGQRGSNRLIFIIPAITALALFMIAEIDVPGKGIIHVSPDNLNALLVTLSHGGLMP